VGSAPILLAATACLVGLPLPRVRSRRDLLNLVLVGVTGPYGTQILFILGLANTSAEKTAIFQLLTPIATALLATLLGMETYVFSVARAAAAAAAAKEGRREPLLLLPGQARQGAGGAAAAAGYDDEAAGAPPRSGGAAAAAAAGLRCAVQAEVRRSWLKLFGIALGVGGLLPLIGISNLVVGADSAREVLGETLLTLNVVTGAAYILLLKPLYRRRYHPLAICAYSYSVAAVCSVLTVAIGRAGPGAVGKYWDISTKEGAVLLYAVFICSALNYAIMTWAFQYMEGTVCALYGGLQPVFTAVGSYFFLDDAGFSGADALGGVIIVLGLVCVTKGQGNEDAMVFPSWCRLADDDGDDEAEDERR
jgi:drug/metabolite transporter (DMT)-like permease